MGVARSLLLGALLLGVSPAAAQDVPDAFDVPWGDAAPRVEGDVVVAAAVGAPDARIGRYAARRAFARRRGRERAVEALHAWADRALAAAHASPREATRVHEALDEAVTVRAVRPLVDAGAVVVVEVPVSALREATGRGGLPWSG